MGTYHRTVRKLIKRIQDRKAIEQVYQLRCPTCSRWPWSLRFVSAPDADCPSCIELRQTNPDPYGGEQIPIFAIEPEDPNS